MRVAFLGPSGTFTEEALRASAEGSVEELPLGSVYETVMAVQTGLAERAIVPIENSLEGSVTATLDALAGDAAGVRIVAEVVRPISHCLIAREQTALADVTRVISHPQAISQCARFIKEMLPAAETASAPSTADAVRTVSSSGRPWAALGPGLAAELYGCVVLAEGVEDRADNLTRFVWLAGADADPLGPPEKTSIVFWGFNDGSPGALVGVLGELAEREINLTKIESRPRRAQLGHYMFFADLAGAVGEEAVDAALAALRERVETLRVLGSYPAWRQGASSG
ncbi:MAG: prephenate dehydratase [Thermoleophilaceae bacterium]